MTKDRLRQIEEVFAAAVELVPEQRGAFLAGSCGGDGELLEEVQSMLELDGHAPVLLRTGIQWEAEQLSSDVSTNVVGESIGPYRIEGVLGRGGMGTVYLARREDAVYEKPVALKVVRRGMDTDEVVRRFRQERRILGRLDHPYIARILDGGTTPDGRPYFVMEYVEGESITNFAGRLAVAERLKLFRQVCEAVEYAHRNLVVHRDLKPGNILVTAEGRPKLLDFGIAKLLTPEDTGLTAAEMRILTPEYASPEQKRGEVVTTASDVYSLGCVLEKVLGEKLDGGELRQMVQFARQEDAQRRYASVAQLDEDVRRYLRGEPVLARPDSPAYRMGKFLRRNRWSALAVTMAVAGLLASTILAVRQAREAESQRRFAVAAKAASEWEARRADEERARAVAEGKRAEAARVEAALQAQRSRDFAGQVAFNLNSRLSQLPGNLQSRKELAHATLDYLERLARDAPDDPRVLFDLARAHLTMAMVYYHVGNNSYFEFEFALAQLEKGSVLNRQLRRRDPGNRKLRSLEAALTHQTGLTLAGMGRWQPALDAHRKFAVLEREVGRESLREIDYRSGGNGLFASIARVLIEMGDYRDALPLLSDEQREKAVALAGMGDLSTAQRLLRRFQPRTQVRPNTYVPLAVAAHGKYTLANITGHPLHLNLGDQQTALTLVRESMELMTEMLSAEPLDGNFRQVLALATATLGALQRESAREEAVLSYQRTITLWNELLSRTPSNLTAQRNLAAAHAGMALPLRKLGRETQASDALLTARRIEDALGEPRSFTRGECGDLELESGNREKALEHYQASLFLAERRIEERPQDMNARREVADAHERLARFHESRGDWRDAREWYGKSLGVWRAWTKHGVSSSYNERREQQAVAALDRLAQKK